MQNVLQIDIIDRNINHICLAVCINTLERKCFPLFAKNEAFFEELLYVSLIKEVSYNLHELNEHSEKQLVDITKFYSEMRKILNDRESTLK